MASGGDMEEVVVSMSKASIEVKEEEKWKKIDRHCAFCVTLIPGAEVKLCSKCKRRAYCSKECQTLDWKSPKGHFVLKRDGDFRGYVQEHRNWCGLQVCEEDLDWKVVQIEGKGLGIIALRDIPPLTRVIVEGRQEVKVCNPTEEEKARVEKNNFTGGLRIRRVNHDCRNNASLADDITNVWILYSNRLIKAGEEICTSYIVGNLMCGIMAPKQLGLSYETPAQCRKELLELYGIVCPPSCICRDERRAQLQMEVVDLTKYCEERFEKEQVDEKFEKAIENGKALGVGALTLAIMYTIAGKYAGKGPEKKGEKGEEYFRMSKEISRALYHPKTIEEFEKSGVYS